jgi:hypothetical protein
MGVKRPLCWESQMTVLRPEEQLTQLRPDWKARRTRDGDHRVFLCEDRYGRQLLLAQKIPLLAEHLTKLASNPSESISTTSLYNIISNDGCGLNGGYSKHRYKVTAYPLEKGIEAFASARESFDSAVVLGSKSCLQTKICT